jgi:hypothetical protein
MPAVRASAHQLQTLVVGAPLADQGIFSPSARCGIAGVGGCEVIAVVANRGRVAAADRYAVYADGRAAGSGIVHVPARSSVDLVVPARPGEQIHARLYVRDALAVDDQAWTPVPGPSGAPPSTTVTLVGAPSDALAVARAFAAVPGVKLRLRTPSSYRPADARSANLAVADGWLSTAGLPPSPAAVLINPPRLPGGSVGGPLLDSTPSGADASSALLSGIDLSSVAIAANASHTLTLPSYLTSLVWSPDGPLLAAGDDGSHRLAVLSFDPSQSDLPQLTAFPILASNLVRRATDWAPSSAPAGEPLRIDATPGARELTGLERCGRRAEIPARRWRGHTAQQPRPVHGDGDRRWDRAPRFGGGQRRCTGWRQLLQPANRADRPHRRTCRRGAGGRWAAGAVAPWCRDRGAGHRVGILAPSYAPRGGSHRMSLQFAQPLFLIGLAPVAIVAILIRARLAPPASPRRALWGTLQWGRSYCSCSRSPNRSWAHHCPKPCCLSTVRQASMPICAPPSTPGCAPSGEPGAPRRAASWSLRPALNHCLPPSLPSLRGPQVQARQGPLTSGGGQYRAWPAAPRRPRGCALRRLGDDP